MANLVDDNDKWAGGETVVVQVRRTHAAAAAATAYSWRTRTFLEPSNYDGTYQNMRLPNIFVAKLSWVLSLLLSSSSSLSCLLLLMVPLTLLALYVVLVSCCFFLCVCGLRWCVDVGAFSASSNTHLATSVGDGGGKRRQSKRLLDTTH